MEKPLISFILTYYDQPIEMLDMCINSILSLSLSPGEREIIIIDDGSTSSPINGLMKYGKDIIYIRKDHGGVCLARNMALSMATGIFIQFVDADDEIIKIPYEHCIDMIRSTNADMVLFDFCHEKNTVSTFHDKGPLSGSELMRSHNIHGSVWGYIFKHSIRSTLAFTQGISYGEDEEFTAQLLLRSESLYTTTAKAYLYRQHNASVTQKHDIRDIIKRLMDTKTVILRLNALADSLPFNDRLAIQRRTSQLTMDYLYNIIYLTHSRHYLERKIKELYKLGLFPLPNKNYTTKYTWFRRLTNSPMGLSLLMRIIPMMNKER